jgi:Ion channel
VIPSGPARIKGRMEGPAPSSEMPAWRRHIDPAGYAFGWLLGIILCSLAFQLGAPEEDWARLTTVVFSIVILALCLRVSRLPRSLVAAAVVAVVVLAVAAVLLISGGGFDAVAGRLLGFPIVLLAPTVIVIGIVRHVRATGVITFRTMFGVLCVYLLIGNAFAFAYGIVSAADEGAFFAQIEGGDQSDFLYFSFVTLTTIGFGDLTAAADLGRALAVTEALVGQIYLVTVVALIVSNMTGPGARTVR